MLKEKEELIIKLLKEGKTQNQILMEARTSPNQVVAIRRRLEGNTEPDIRNQAYVMFREGKKPIDVAIALKIDNVEAIRYWKEYLQLTREFDLLRIRNELKKAGYGLSQLVNLYLHMEKKKYNIDDLKRALEVVSNLESEQFNLTFAEAQRERAREEVEQLKKEINKLRDNKVIAKHQLESLEAMVQLFLIALESVSKEKENIENQLEEFYKNSASYVQTNLGVSNYALLPGIGRGNLAG